MPVKQTSYSLNWQNQVLLIEASDASPAFESLFLYPEMGADPQEDGNLSRRLCPFPIVKKNDPTLQLGFV